VGNNVAKQFDEYALFYAPVQGAVATTQWSIRILSVYPSTLAGALGVGGTTAPGAQLQVNPTAAGVTGALVRGYASQSANLLELQNSASAIQFAIGPAGSIRTNQTAAGTVLGSVTNKLPIYNTAGTLIGYAPIYDAIT
jgi:hypothetical protein